MSQALQEESAAYPELPNTALSQYFRTAGDKLADEAAMLGSAIRIILASGGQLTNKAIILQLIHMVERTDDVVTGDILRKTLEIIVDHTIDDL
ncbi:biofilm development regulator YmgB/AriR family protein [Superficieibacter sp.]|uniref:biofilm development regulator YmgB/AriR family protein n=1 Tax=Superficieibacter sp. TaxID=2303322 RepID=UPI0028A59A18|nr:biofilm development regulator YmgB/AriR family protein [Superficieibacter sp.]